MGRHGARARAQRGWFVLFFKQKTAYEIPKRDWSSDVCSSDLMVVGGWYDTEDPQGPLRQFDFMEKNTPPALTLVMGPWNHGGFARGDGDRLGNVNFGSKTGVYYREKIELPFFLYYLKGRGA